MRLFASCAPGLEPLLAREVTELALGAPTVVVGGVEFEGDLATVLRANLELGLALFVLVRLAELRVTKLPDLVRKVAALDVRPFLSKGQPLAVRVRARASRLYHTGAIEERVRLGLGESLGEPPREPSEGEPHVSLHVRVDHDVCTLSLDTSGETLHKRGYRQETAKAPFREDLARALILLSGWNRTSPFVDPLMGSGTLPIEAAMLARRIAPGHGRSFAIELSPCCDRALAARVRREARARELPSLPFPIHGSDRDAGAHRAATANAERAGVLGDLSLACAPLSTAPYRVLESEPEGALVTNPPWGLRIGEGRDLRPLYQALGKAIERLPSAWKVGVVTGDKRLVHAMGAPLESAVLTDQGGTKVWMFVRPRGA